MLKYPFLFLLLFCFVESTPAQNLNLNAATQPLYEYVQAHPDDQQKKMDLAYLFSEGLEFDRAIALYEEVLQNLEHNQRALNELCYLYTLTRDQQKAYKTCAELAENFPNSYLSYDNLGLSQYKFGDNFAALRSFMRASRLAPDSWLVKNHVGMTFLALQDFAGARDLYTDWLANFVGSDAERAILYYGLFNAEKALGHRAEAYAAIAKTYELSQNPLYWGPKTKAFLRRHEFWFFVLGGGLFLMLCQYLGKRLNRFLKNEN